MTVVQVLMYGAMQKSFHFIPNILLQLLYGIQITVFDFDRMSGTNVTKQRPLQPYHNIDVSSY